MTIYQKGQSTSYSDIIMLSKNAFAFILASCILWFYYTSVREQSTQPATSLRSSSSIDLITLHYTAASPAVSSATHEEQSDSLRRPNNYDSSTFILVLCMG